MAWRQRAAVLLALACLLASVGGDSAFADFLKRGPVAPDELLITMRSATAATRPGGRPRLQELRLAALRTRRLLGKVRRTIAALKHAIEPWDVVSGPAPRSSYLTCHVVGTGYEVCQYENMCITQGRAEFIPGAREQAEKNRLILFLEPGATPADDRDHDAAAMPPSVRRVLDEKRQQARQRTEKLPPSGLPHRDHTQYSHVWDIWMASPGGLFGDGPDRQHGFWPHTMPFNLASTGMTTSGASVLEGVPVEWGGAWNGTVTWVDNLYMVNGITGDNLAEYSATGTSPLALAKYYNASLGLGLPPLDNLHVFYNAEQWLGPAWVAPYGWGNWITGALNRTLRYVRDGAVPFLGREAPAPTSKDTHDAHVLAGVSHRLRDACCKPSGGAAKPVVACSEPPTQAELNACLAASPEARQMMAPAGAFTLQHRSPGSRLLFTEQDIPRPPSPEDVLAAEDGRPPPFDPELRPERHRVCARRFAIAGRLANYLPTGELERAAARRYAAVQVDAPTVGHGDYGSLPPPVAPGVTHDADTGAPRVLIIDRSKTGEPRGRYFENIDEMLGVCAKYALNCTVITEDTFGRASYEWQLQLHRTFPIVVAPHGANEASAFTMPRRGVIIEVQPRMMWCDSFNKGSASTDLFALPIRSRLKPYQERFQPGPMKDERMKIITETYTNCDAVPMVEMPGNMPCWYPLREQMIRMPIAEFDLQLLRALDIVGHRVTPSDESLMAVQGIPVQGEEEAPASPPDGWYEARGWLPACTAPKKHKCVKA